MYYVKIKVYDTTDTFHFIEGCFKTYYSALTHWNLIGCENIYGWSAWTIKHISNFYLK